jgi:hypothetical protein
MPFPPTFTNNWDVTFPPDTQLANLLGQDLRQVRTDVMQRMSLLSGTLANRPTPEILNATWGGAGFGLLYFSTDNGKIYQWNGAAWADVTSSFLTVPLIVSGGASGLSNIVATVNLVNQAATTGNQVLYAVPVGAAGMYRLSWDVIVTTVGTGGTVGAILGWNNGVTAQVFNGVSTSVTVLGNELTLAGQTIITFFSAASQNITYNFAFGGVTGTPKYSAYARLEYLG